MTQVAMQAAKTVPVLPIHPHNAGANLTLKSTDAEMLAAVQADNALLNRMQASAQEAYLAARAIRQGPLQSVDRTWQDARAASLTAIAKAGGRDAIGTRTVADWTARVAMVRTAMEVGDHFRDLVTRYDTISEDERARLYAQDNLQAAALRARTGAASMVQTTAAPFDPQPLLAGLAQRGIHLSASAGGTLLAAPGRALTAQDREALKTHKAAIVAALGDVEVF